MFYIIVGICIVVVIITLFLIDKYAAFSEMMGSFSNSGFKKLMVGLSIAAVLSISYGIYAKITYQPPFLDVSINGSSYTIFGDIGDIGYYSDGLVTVNQQVEVNLVSWEELNLADEVDMLVTYPSGKKVSWTSSVTSVEDASINEVKAIYKLSPYTFEEAGNVTITIKDKSTRFTIDVKE
ncbi:hypothetical protein [Virgibacillus necropolis]|uniref:Uncharacterized protein n=1 Tax=Virgibacillus necropolis TaxID=163877 RepID=A0A221M869_9BACI|nr:hypothetical protein [Virgibacillus necropolis]ASN03830.1 hypothetical protein CFK40_01840 [Virgibacillus necropolis]